MNRKRMSVTLTLSIAFVTTFSIATAPLTSAATKPKAAGRTSTTIPNTILNGKGAPLLKVGIDGDFYIDTRSLLIYGPKKSGKWPLPQNLQGPVGANGADGKNGSEGKTVSTASTIAGPAGSQGSQGSQGEKGEKGEKGDAGSPGATGSAGPAGATGATGPQGPSGGGGGGTPGPTGATGATGATGLTGAKGETGTAGADGVAGAVGLKGETGTTGATGPTGAKGDTGTIGATGSVGATGPSNVYVNSISTWTLSTATKRTFSVSAITPKFIGGKSYVYTIYIYGVSDANAAAFSLEVLHEDNSAANFNYSIGFANGLELDPKMYRYFFTITGTFTPVSADSGIAIKIIDDMGVTSTRPMSLSGRMYSTLVGSIGAL
jgi:hypothetical protein